MPTRITEVTIEDEDAVEHDGEPEQSMQEEDDGPVFASRKRPASARLQIEDSDNFPHHDGLDDEDSEDDDEESEGDMSLTNVLGPLPHDDDDNDED